VRLNPGDANTQFWLGKILFDKKRHQEAFAPLHAASELYPDGERRIEVRQRLLTTLTILGRDAEAEDVRQELSALLGPPPRRDHPRRDWNGSEGADRPRREASWRFPLNQKIIVK